MDVAMHNSDTFQQTSAALMSVGAILLLGGCSLMTELDALSTGDGVQSNDVVAGGASGGAGGAANAGGAGGAPEVTSGSGGGLAATGATGTAGASTSSGTGGAAPCNPTDVDYESLLINEIAPDGDPLDWIELANASAEPIWLCNVFITQHYNGGAPPSGADRYTFGDVYIQPMQRLVIQTQVDFLFGLDKDESERITLFDPAGGMIDDSQWTADASTAFSEAESWARVPDITGDFVRTSPTKGVANTSTP
jgi:hypothetical protein